MKKTISQLLSLLLIIPVLIVLPFDANAEDGYFGDVSFNINDTSYLVYDSSKYNGEESIDGFPVINTRKEITYNSKTNTVYFKDSDIFWIDKYSIHISVADRDIHLDFTGRNVIPYIFIEVTGSGKGAIYFEGTGSVYINNITFGSLEPNVPKLVFKNGVQVDIRGSYNDYETDSNGVLKPTHDDRFYPLFIRDCNVDPKSFITIEGDITPGLDFNKVISYIDEDGTKHYAYIAKESDYSITPKKDDTLNGIIKGPDGKWALYANGVVQSNVSTIEKNDYGWWRIDKGYVDFNANGIYKNDFGWWKTTDGKVTFKETGIFKNDFGWWRVKDSKVDFNANGIYKNDYGWWKTTNGRVTFKENGIFKNEYGWWKVVNSKVDFGFTGLASNEYGTWYVKNGKVDFDYNGTYNGKKIKGGKVVNSSSSKAVAAAAIGTNSSGSTKSSSGYTGKVRVSRNGIYHKAVGACGPGKKMKNYTTYSSPSAAERAGYRACHNCF